MFNRHRYTSQRLSAYHHKELAEAEARRVEAHLCRCPRCRQEYEEIVFGDRLAARLAPLPAPESLWSRIEARLEAPAAVEARRLRVPPLRRSVVWRPALALAVLLLLAVGAALWRHMPPLPPLPSGPALAVVRIDGAPRIAGDRLNTTGKLAVGQWLVTDGVSRARIAVANIGHVDVEPNTRIGLLVTRANEHRLDLKQGTISARVTAPPHLFFVDTPTATAEDLGCAYTLVVDKEGGSRLHVTLGQVQLALRGGREATVPAGGICETRPGVGPGTPYFDDAPAALRSALEKYDFENGGTAALKIVLAQARSQDTLTLWYLLIHVPPVERGLVYDRLTAFVSPPPDLTRASILKLDLKTLPAALERWEQELEQDWYNRG